MARIMMNVEKTFDRGPTYPFLEVQVSFEEKSQASDGTSFGQVMVPLAKAQVGGMTFDQIRALALSKAVSFMEECVKGANKK